jgi:preprotein translocase subunit SecD
MARNLIACSALLSFFVIIGTVLPSFADEIKATDQIKKNPAMMEMLKKIELSKKILAQMQEGKTIDNTKAQQMQELRNKVKASLAEEVNRMNKDYEQYNSQNAFAKFVSKKPGHVQPIYQAMFSYHQEKVSQAKSEYNKIISSGGKTKDAWDAYHKSSATNRIKLIQLNKDLSIKYGNADPAIQNTFDEKGKLPRTSE